MSAGSRGHARERQVRKLLDDDGWWTCRAAGSLGDADVVAAKSLVSMVDNDQALLQLPTSGAGDHAHIVTRGRVAMLLVEVKTDVRGPFAHFGPEQRAELVSAALRTGATPLLAWWPARKPLRWIGLEAWPP